MRGAESALYDRRIKDLDQLRDDDVTALEIRIAVLGALMLLAVGIATAMARTPHPARSSVLRRGSARLAEAEDPAAEEPVNFTGRNDEFAQVVRSVNALHAHAVALAERVTTLESDRKHLVGQRQKMADAREQLQAELAESAAQLERLRTSIGATFVNLALRTLGLVERQLAVIEGLEEREQDPERLATLFKLDHFATVMRRHSENLLVLAGTEHVQQSAGRSRSSTSSAPRSARSSGTSGSASRPCRRTRTSPGSPRTTSPTCWPNSWRTPPRSPRPTCPSRSPAGCWRAARSCSPSRTRASA